MGSSGKVYLYGEKGRLIKSWNVSPWPNYKVMFQNGNYADCIFVDSDTKNRVVIKGGIVIYEGKDD